MKKKLSACTLFLLLGLVMLTTSCSYFKKHQIEEQIEESVEIPMMDFEPPEFCPEDFEMSLSYLLEMQGHLFDDAMAALILDAPEEIVMNGQTNLFHNTHEIAMLFSTVYEPEVAARIERLLDQDICLFFDYINALKNRDKASAKKILVQSYANGHMLVQFLNIMNPYFAYEPEKYMFDEHVTLLTNQAAAYFRRDYNEAKVIKRRSIKQLRELAIHVTKAIRKQYEPSCSSQTFCETFNDQPE